jgi:hypothetical protein
LQKMLLFELITVFFSVTKIKKIAIHDSYLLQ